MTREEVKAILEAGRLVSYHVWVWASYYVSCGEGCCDDGFTDVDDTLDHIETIVSGDWNCLQVLN